MTARTARRAVKRADSARMTATCPTDPARADPGGDPQLSADFLLHATATETSVRALLEDARTRLAARGIPEQVCGTVELALAEALNNIVEHAYAQAETGTITLDARLVPGGLRCILSDRGAPLPARTLPRGHPPRVDTARDALPEGGFGWFLIRSLAREVHYAREAGVNRLTLGFDLPAPGLAAR